MILKINDKVYYPGLGPGIVTNIETKELMGIKKEFVTIHITDHNVKVMLPTIRLDSVGIRPITDESTIKKSFNSIKKGLKLNRHPGWIMRSSNYAKKVKSGDFLGTLLVLKALNDRKKINQKRTTNKELSFAEKNLYDNALSLIRAEISLSMGLTANDAETMIRSQLQ